MNAIVLTYGLYTLIWITFYTLEVCLFIFYYNSFLFLELINFKDKNLINRM